MNLPIAWATRRLQLVSLAAILCYATWPVMTQSIFKMVIVGSLLFRNNFPLRIYSRCSSLQKYVLCRRCFADNFSSGLPASINANRAQCRSFCVLDRPSIHHYNIPVSPRVVSRRNLLSSFVPNPLKSSRRKQYAEKRLIG